MTRGAGLVLRIDREGADACLPPQEVAPGVALRALELRVPAAPPVDVARGAAQFRHLLCDLRRLEVALTDEALPGLVAGLDLAAAGIAELEAALRPGFAELRGRLASGAAFTAKAAPVPAAEGGTAVALVVYEARVYAAAALAPSLSAAELAPLLALAARARALCDGTAITADVMRPLLRRLLPARGWKVPRTEAVHLSVAEVRDDGLVLAFTEEGDPRAPQDPDLAAALEGSRRFAAAETALARGEPAAARDAYLALGDAARTHPFGLARLLALLVAFPEGHAPALALAEEALASRPELPAALLAAAQVHAARGEAGAAASALAALGDAALRRGEEWAALAAAEACLALAPDGESEAAGRALELALALRRDHLPALRALRARGERGDRAALLRAARRLAAYAPSPLERAEAHAALAGLLLGEDPAAAQLHLAHAERLAPHDARWEAALERARRLGPQEVATGSVAPAAPSDDGAAADALRAGADSAGAALVVGAADEPRPEAPGPGGAAVETPPPSVEGAPATRGGGPQPGRTEPAALEARAADLAGPEAAALLRALAARHQAEGHLGAALRCARAALARDPDDLAAGGPLLARLLHQAGGGSEALDLHRRLVELDLTGEPGEDSAALLSGAADLALEVGDLALARAALTRALEHAPHDLDLALRRFDIDPDRGRAVAELAEAADGSRSARRRADALARAACEARRRLGDVALSEALFARARGAALPYPVVRAAVEEVRASLLRTGAGGTAGAVELAAALRELAAARDEAGDAEGADAALLELVDLLARDGQRAAAARELAALEARAQRAGDSVTAADRALRSAALWLGPPADVERAEPPLRRFAEAVRAGAVLGRERLDAGVAAARRLADALGAAELEGGEGRRDAALALGAELAARGEDRGPEAAAVLEALASRALAAVGPGDDADADATEALAERAVTALVRAGENARASALLARAARAASGRRRAVWLARLAEAALARGDRAAARAAREEALLADPSDLALRDTHLAELEGAGEHAALVRAIEAALRSTTGADAASLRVRLAGALARLGDANAAAAVLLRAAEPGPIDAGWERAADAVGQLLQERGELSTLGRLALARAEGAAAPTVRANAFLAAVPILERLGDLDGARAAAEGARDAEPDSPGPWSAIARVMRLSGDRVSAARALLGVALRAEGADTAQAALEAARLLELAGRPGDAGRALQAAVRAVPSFAPARRALAERALAAGDPRAAAGHLTAMDVAALAPEERAQHERTLARALTAAGDPAAARAWEPVFRRDPGDGEAFAALAGEARAAGDTERWLALAAAHEGALAPTGEREQRRDLRAARAEILEARGDLDAAEGAWQAALALDPAHAPARAGVERIRARRGAQGAAGGATPAGDAAEPPPGAVSRAEVGAPADAGRAAAAGEEAIATSTVEAEAEAAVGTGALEAALEQARVRPGEREALAALALAAASEASRDATRTPRTLGLARAAGAALAFASGEPLPVAPFAPRALSPEERAGALHPAAQGAPARLLALLGPYLERLFPADLARRGVGPSHRLSDERGPALAAELATLRPALGVRPFAAFLADLPGSSVSLENTQPVALILRAELAGLPAPHRRFLLARALVLADLGGALVEKFAPRDVAILCELATRFAGGHPARQQLVGDRAGAFLDALALTTPAPVRAEAEALGEEAASALASLDPRALAAGLRHSANRAALLHVRDLGAALEAVRGADRRLRALAPPSALVHPEVRELVAFAFGEGAAALAP